MRFEYKASVIIPVFNAIKTLPATLKSLLDQTLGMNELEIILVDDGSSDGSSNLCDRYAQEYSNIFVFHQSNHGVSAARNNGLRHARGEFIFYLDADDQLSVESIDNVVSFFYQHEEEIDVVAYPLTYVFENGKKNIHWRYQSLLLEEKVYPLTEGKNCFISQTTMNICVKNDKNIFFDEKLKYGEDQLYITSLLVRKNAVGYVPNANYLYFRSSSSAASSSGSLMNSFQDVKRLFSKLAALKKTYPSSKKYIDALIVYNCEWRIKGDYFYPYHLQKQDFNNEMNMIGKLFDDIDPFVICDYPQTGIEHKYFMLSLKKKDRPTVNLEKNCIRTLTKHSNEELFSRTKIDIVINKLDFTDKEIYILAFVKFLEAPFVNLQPNLVAVFDKGRSEETVKLFPSQYSCYGSNMQTNQFSAFSFRKPTGSFKTVCFEMEADGHRYLTRIWYSEKTSVNLEIHRNYVLGKSIAVLCNESELSIVNANTFQVKKAVFLFNRFVSVTYPKHWGVRNLLSLYSHTNKRIWIYSDSHDTIDNGFFQFKHDFKIPDGVERYYIYPADKQTILPEKAFQQYGSHLIPFGSFKHKVLLVQAEKMLVAYVGRGSTVPYSKLGEKVYKDLLTYKIIYLQHGVMNAKLPNMYSKEKVYNIDKIVVSTNFEKDNMMKLAYEEGDVLTCGMPRFDYLRREKNNQRKGRILFAPSWRKRLVATINRVQTPVEVFYHSIFFKSYYAFLHDQAVEEFLERNDLYLDVQMHPMFSCYDDSFEIEKLKRIRKVHFSNPSDYDCCITDFSSILFDYIYLNKPVISYFPDKEEFKGGTHTYREFSFPVEDGFMLVCNNNEEVIQGIKELYQNQMKLPEHIQRRADNLFFNQGEHHRDAIYNALKN